MVSVQCKYMIKGRKRCSKMVKSGELCSFHKNKDASATSSNSREPTKSPSRNKKTKDSDNMIDPGSVPVLEGTVCTTFDHTSTNKHRIKIRKRPPEAYKSPVKAKIEKDDTMGMATIGRLENYKSQRRSLG